VTQVVVEALWRDLLAEVQRVAREIERDRQGESMMKKRNTVAAQPVVAPPQRADAVVPMDVDQSSEDSFPASDPPAWAPLHVGAPRNISVASPPVRPRA
jgi:hypothetical protein